jgi:hypothetical protein
MSENSLSEPVNPTKKRTKKKPTTAAATAAAATTSTSEPAVASPPIIGTNTTVTVPPASTNIQYVIEEEPTQPDVLGSKKRGRKPRGGKLIVKPSEINAESSAVSNIILHLKCSLSDLNEYYQRMSKMVTDPLKYNPEIPTEIQTYNDVFDPFNHFDKSNIEGDDTKNKTKETTASKYPVANGANVMLDVGTGTFCSQCSNRYNEINVSDISLESNETDNVNLKEINQKLKQLKIMLYKNTLQQDKKSACFWCTCDYDNTPCYIPVYEEDGVIYGYGSFCRPECAVAYLMKENLDDSKMTYQFHDNRRQNTLLLEVVQ